MTADLTAHAADEPSPGSPAASARRARDAGSGDGGGGWVVVADGAADDTPDDRPVSLQRVLLQLSLVAVAVLGLVAVGGSLASRRVAETLSIHEAAQINDLLAESLVQPALTDAMVTDPAAARAGLEAVVRDHVLTESLVRVKLWTAEGRIVYSDEPRDVGRTFVLDDGARSVFTDPQTRAEISDLGRPENAFERAYPKLLEVYRPVYTPSGTPLLFETYFRYDDVDDRTGQLWRGFLGIVLSTILALVVLTVPLVWTLLARARRAQTQREQMMQRAVAASDTERRRIAATLHDGIVQDLAAVSYAVAGGAQEAAARGDTALAARLDEAAAGVRSSLGGMRSLLVDIYPPSLTSAGLATALHDLAATVAGRSPEVVVDVDPAAAETLSADRQQAVFRVAQEALRNAVRHSGARLARITLRPDPDGVLLEVRDDGAGFDVAAAGAEGHFGLRLMADAAEHAGARLQVDSGPGRGTTWQLRVPR